MRARYGEHPAVLENLPGKPLRSRSVGNTTLQHRLHDGLAPGHDIAYDHDIRHRVELAGFEPFSHGNPQRLELRAHGRIDIAVGACDPVAGGARDRRDSAHESAADTENVNVHRSTFRCRRGTGRAPAARR